MYPKTLIEVRSNKGGMFEGEENVLDGLQVQEALFRALITNRCPVYLQLRVMKQQNGNREPRLRPLA
jgi:hypothetical protein